MVCAEQQGTNHANDATPVKLMLEGLRALSPATGIAYEKENIKLWNI